MTGQRSNQLNYVPLKGEASQWWALSDLNGRPFGCKPNALTAELSAQTHFIVQEAARSVNAETNVLNLVCGTPCHIRMSCRAELQHSFRCAKHKAALLRPRISA